MRNVKNKYLSVVTVFVSSKSRLLRVVFPWSICAITAKFLTLLGGYVAISSFFTSTGASSPEDENLLRLFESIILPSLPSVASFS